jgi:hypothetical protein
MVMCCHKWRIYWHFRKNQVIARVLECHRAKNEALQGLESFPQKLWKTLQNCCGFRSKKCTSVLGTAAFPAAVFLFLLPLRATICSLFSGRRRAQGRKPPAAAAVRSGLPLYRRSRSACGDFSFAKIYFQA